ncbi:MAG: hypothetical protein COB30_007420 [Ectothiorhodospiraceae bacterium]|nr:hypothetical protein [Ectothiorhodospiraceae bacterium]
MAVDTHPFDAAEINQLDRNDADMDVGARVEPGTKTENDYGTKDKRVLKIKGR